MLTSSRLRGRSCNFEEAINVGPWVGHGGSEYSCEAKGGITEIIISHAYNTGIRFSPGDDGNGRIEYSDKFGGNVGKTEKVN